MDFILHWVSFSFQYTCSMNTDVFGKGNACITLDKLMELPIFSIDLCYRNVLMTWWCNFHRLFQIVSSINKCVI